LKVVGLYPRRPKLISAGSSKITVKINDQILLGAQCGMKHGIPIIAGCPLARNFWELGNNPKCAWIKLDQDSTHGFELEFQPPYYMSPFSFSNEEDLLIYLSENSESTGFDTAIRSFRDIKEVSTKRGFHSYFGLAGGYKPVYFLLQ
jgi:hypothetical protein